MVTSNNHKSTIMNNYNYNYYRQTTQLKLKIISTERNVQFKKRDNLQRSIEHCKARLIHIANEISTNDTNKSKEDLEMKELILNVVDQIIDLLSSLYDETNAILHNLD